MRGVSRSLTGEGISALKSCMPPTPSSGRMARERMMIPMPPSHWVRARQKRMPLEVPSRFDRTEAPVVVNPDMVSKKASQ
ncbi:MAG: hypothetical protein A4E67_00933 [Syntrophaceae bacterium PtaB.Bin038]|nr:MAG: hypothetical protein A4E67_00933 [Syntrophaceae bacterium PtaB.Bin038]